MAISKIENNSLASGVPGRANLPAGTVLQVVNATYGTQVNSSTNTSVDTGLTATITPTSASSKILVLVDQNGCGKTSSTTSLVIDLYRNTTQITRFAQYAGDTGTTTNNSIGSVSGCYLDSPATTSAVTYKTQFYSGGNAAQVYVQYAGNTNSTITLMEIAA